MYCSQIQFRCRSKTDCERKISGELHAHASLTFSIQVHHHLKHWSTEASLAVLATQPMRASPSVTCLWSRAVCCLVRFTPTMAQARPAVIKKSFWTPPDELEKKWWLDRDRWEVLMKGSQLLFWDQSVGKFRCDGENRKKGGEESSSFDFQMRWHRKGIFFFKDANKMLSGRSRSSDRQWSHGHLVGLSSQQTWWALLE